MLRSDKNSPLAAFALFSATAVLALALRLPGLEQRPMHGDEAVHAIKFGDLLERGFYRYDRYEYHGPTLNYFTLIPAWLGSAKKLAEVDERALRLVPVFFGTALVLMAALLRRDLGGAGNMNAAAFAAMLTAISPAMSYYSRYYIQEMLLVCFTFGVIVCGYRYTQHHKLGWALAAGVCLGLMHATKETCLIAWGAMAPALVLAFVMEKGESFSRFTSAVKSLNGRHVLAALFAAAAVSVMFFSSFFTNPAGVLDSILTYRIYFSRAGQNPLHIHPWHYYLNLLAYFRLGANPFWSEGLILILAVAGFAVALRGRESNSPARLLRFLAFYTLFMTAIYSLIPYKTPWCLIGFLHGMILLAGVGAAALLKMLHTKFSRVAMGALLAAAGMHLAWQAYAANFKYYEDPANPYVYAHPVSDVLFAVRRVEEIAQAHPDGSSLHLHVICPNDDYWPLPWYFRAFTNVGWWKEVDESVPAAPVIIAAPQFEPALRRKFYELPPPGQRSLYVPLFDSYTELRPQIELRGYVRKDLWDRWQERKAQGGGTRIKESNPE